MSLVETLGVDEGTAFAKVLITKEMAEELLKYNTNNRPISKSIVSHYREKMLNGEWGLAPDCICFSPTTHELVNGQHRLKAVATSGVACEFYVSLEIEPMMGVDTGRRRNLKDNLRIGGVTFKNGNLPAILGTALSFCNGRYDRTYRSEETIRQCILHYIDDLVYCDSVGLFDRIPFPGCSTKPMYAAIFLAYVNGVDVDKLVRMHHVMDIQQGNLPIDRPVMALQEQLIKRKGLSRELHIERFTLTCWCIHLLEEGSTSKSFKVGDFYYKYDLMECLNGGE